MSQELATKPKKNLPLPFVNDAGDVLYQPRTRREQRMGEFLNSIRDKLDWARKWKQDEIRTRWTAHLEKHVVNEKWTGYKPGTRKRVGEPLGAMPGADFQYVLKELAWQAEHLSTMGGPDGVFVGDKAVSDEMCQLLAQQVFDLLENVPNTQKDWHPRSNNQVLDLVHPSLYPLVYGRSRVLDAPMPSVDDWYKFMSGGEPVTAPRTTFMSERFQWLPSDFEVGEDGKVVIRSYINNLHPETHMPLYATLARIFECAVPLLEQVLGRLETPTPLRIKPDPEDWYEEYESEEEDEECVTSEEEDEDEDADDKHENGDEKGLEETNPANAELTSMGSVFAAKPERKYESWDDWFENRVPVIPDPPAEYDVEGNAFTPYSLRGRTLKVITKLANIHLTVDNPKYPGGSWHIEGMLNESIIATAIYYWDVENITDSKLHFRTGVQPPTYEQSDNRGIKLAYGLYNHGPLMQYCGYITAKQGRLVAFPNLYQHQVAPFELKDPTRPGHRKIVAFFLVDPSSPAGDKVVSTSRVPPQQAEWISREWSAAGQFPLAAGAELPREMVDLIVSKVESAMALDEAKALRLKLMDERTTADRETERETPRFNLCEH
ncbi:hypothetical protein GGF31_007034 [Allomyces arbusculus]|nr:hypothetical protein GGF31_007034 [Allomyces arbusculus]